MLAHQEARTKGWDFTFNISSAYLCARSPTTTHVCDCDMLAGKKGENGKQRPPGMVGEGGVVVQVMDGVAALLQLLQPSRLDLPSAPRVPKMVDTGSRSSRMRPCLQAKELLVFLSTRNLMISCLGGCQERAINGSENHGGENDGDGY
jgi:hypothetical protein